MKLLRFETENLRGVADGQYSFAHPHTGVPFDTVYIAGPMAAGKTSFLQAIALVKEHVAGYGAALDPRAFLRAGESNGRLCLSLLLNETELERAQLSEPVQQLEMRLSGVPADVNEQLRGWLRVYTHDPQFGKLTIFPADRQLSLPSWGAAEPMPSEMTEARLCLSSDAEKYRGVAPWLREQFVAAAAATGGELRAGGILTAEQVNHSMATFAERFASLVPHLRVHGLSEDGGAVLFVRQDGSRLRLEELSSGERDGLLFAATHCRLGLNASVVLVDRPALWVPHGDHTRWLAALGNLGKDNQVIAASTSPLLLSSVSPAQVIQLG